MTVSVDVKNTGKYDRAKIEQLYITDFVVSVDRHSKELKGFEKVYLRAGETKTVTFTIDADDLSYFDMSKSAWYAEQGEFKALFASSSADVTGNLPANHTKRVYSRIFPSNTPLLFQESLDLTSLKAEYQDS